MSCCGKRLYTITNISVATAGTFENCNNLAPQDAPLKNKIVMGTVI
jgi:hypothetical protein